MAIVYFVRDGEPQVGSAVAEKPLAWCVENLDLRQEMWIASLETPNLTIRETTGFFGVRQFVARSVSTGEVWACPSKASRPFTIVVGAIDKPEFDGNNVAWKLGFYVAHIAPREAEERLGSSTA